MRSHPDLAAGVVLDIGCGSGAGTAQPASLLNPRQKVIGLDINAQAIHKATARHAAQANLSFHHGDFDAFLRDHPDLRIAGILCISVSMFLPDVQAFYQRACAALMPGGMFSQQRRRKNEAFAARTYAMCGCNMKMLQQDGLQNMMQEAGFSRVDSHAHEFELMKLSRLFTDYPAKRLIGNFFRNVRHPPGYFAGTKSSYLLRRTISIFLFFMKNRTRFASGTFIGIKSHAQDAAPASIH